MNDASNPTQTPSKKNKRIEGFWARVMICAVSGFSSGLPLYFLLSLLPAWLKTEQVSLKTIGAFSLVMMPYTWKFLWAPLLDRYSIPWLGRRRGWMLIWQILLFASIPLFGQLHPKMDIWTIAYIATAIAFFSASQDIVLDAYRREILPDAELGLGNSIFVNTYRIAGLIPGSLSLILADHMSWANVFLITALFMLPGALLTALIKEPLLKQQPPRTLQAAITLPFKEFIMRKGWQNAAFILLFIFLYKLGDSMATALATPFYLDIGFSKTEIGIVAKNAGLWCSVAGGLLGGLWMMKIGINRALWLFGLVQLVSILGFAWLSTLHAPSIWSLGLVIGFEALGVGLGTAAFVAYIARTTNPAYTATQFALFTSLSAVPRTIFNAFTGAMVETFGWYRFFLVCTGLAIPGLLLLLKVAPWNNEESSTKSPPQP